MPDELKPDVGPDPSLLLVDDDGPFVTRLARAMEKRGFVPETAESVEAGKIAASTRPPAYAVVDLRLGDGNGLDVVETLREHRPDCRVVILTGYGAIATAVAAVKVGATDYLSKPADADDVVNALLAKGDDSYFAKRQAYSALNFQLTVILAYIVCIPFVLIVIGIPMMWFVGLSSVVLVCIAGIKALDGRTFSYPFSIQFFG